VVGRCSDSSSVRLIRLTVRFGATLLAQKNFMIELEFDDMYDNSQSSLQVENIRQISDWII
jgi:hypothetical protein